MGLKEKKSQNNGQLDKSAIENTIKDAAIKVASAINDRYSDVASRQFREGNNEVINILKENKKILDDM